MSLCVRSKFAFLGPKSAPLSAVISRREKGTALGTKGDNLAALKKGTGGRSSFNGVVATVFGASGLLGPYLVNALGKCGTMMVLPHRCDSSDVVGLKVSADLGQVVLTPLDIRDEKIIADTMKHSNVVINLIGKDVETVNFKFKEVHVDFARTVAKLSRELGVEKLIHFSALNACEKPKRQTLRPSKFYASKWEGEQAVRQEFPGAIVFRPSDIYGYEDRFLHYYASLARRTANWVPVWGRGEGVQKCPVAVSDVAKAVVKAVFEKDNEGEVYQAIGPRMYKLGELIDFMYECMERSDKGYVRYDMRMDPFFLMRVAVVQSYARYPILNFERLERENTSDNVDDDLRNLTHLGVELTKVETRFPYILKHKRQYGYGSHDRMTTELSWYPKFTRTD